MLGKWLKEWAGFSSPGEAVSLDGNTLECCGHRERQGPSPGAGAWNWWVSVSSRGEGALHLSRGPVFPSRVGRGKSCLLLQPRKQKRGLRGGEGLWKVSHIILPPLSIPQPRHRPPGLTTDHELCRVPWGFGISKRKAWLHLPPLPPTCPITVNKSPTFSEPWFPHR